MGAFSPANLMFVDVLNKRRQSRMVGSATAIDRLGGRGWRKGGL